MSKGLKNPTEVSRVLSSQIIGFNKSTFLRNYKSMYRQQPRAPIRRKPRKDSAELRVEDGETDRLKPMHDEEVADTQPIDVKIDNSKDTVDGESTIAPTAIDTQVDATNISVIANKEADLRDKKDEDVSSIGKGAPTVDTSVAGGRQDDSLLDAALLSDANTVHPTIRRTEVVQKEKADKLAK